MAMAAPFAHPLTLLGNVREVSADLMSSDTPPVVDLEGKFSE